MNFLLRWCVRPDVDRDLTLMRIAEGFKCRVRARAELVLLVAVVSALLSAPALAGERPCKPVERGQRVSVDFRSVSLETVGRYVSCAAEIGLLYSPSALRSRVITVVAPNPVDAQGLVRVFEAALRGHGLFLEKRGAYYLVREDAQVPSKSRSTRGR